MIFLGSADVSLIIPNPSTELFAAGMVPMRSNFVVRSGWFEYDPVDPTNIYGGTDGDIVVQVIDVSGTAPVVVNTARYAMRPLDGTYPYNWRQRTLKLDDSRLAILWHSDANSVRIQIVEIGTDGSITFGTPVHVGSGAITVQNEDQGYGTLLDPHTEDQAGVLADGRVVYIGVVRRYTTPGDNTTWKEVLTAAHVRTSGLTVVDVRWWYLNRDTAHDRSAYSNIQYDEYVDAHHLGEGKLWHIWGRTGAVEEYKMAVLDFGAANVQAVPTWENAALSFEPMRHVERVRTSAGDKLVMWQNYFGFSDWHIVDVANPLGAVHVAPMPDGGASSHMLMSAYAVTLEYSSPTAKGGFWGHRMIGPDFVEMELVEWLVDANGAVREGRLVPVPNTKPADATDPYGTLLVQNGNRTLFVRDFQSAVAPNNYPEIGHLYYDLVPTIGMGENKSRFLQVRSGV